MDYNGEDKYLLSLTKKKEKMKRSHTTTTTKSKNKKIKQQDAFSKMKPTFSFPLELSFHEYVSDDLLAEIFKYISHLNSYFNLMLVNKQFHQVLFSVEANCFEFICLNYSKALQMPNYDLVKRCTLNDNDRYHLFDQFDSVNETETKTVDVNDSETEHRTRKDHLKPFPFNKLKYIEIYSDEGHLLSPLFIKLNKQELEHIRLNSSLCKEVLQLIVNECSNLKTLEIEDLYDLEHVSSSNSSVTTFKYNDTGVFLEYTSDATNINDMMNEYLVSWFPNLRYIEIEPLTIHLEIIQLFRMLLKPSFPMLKKLKLHVVVFHCEDEKELINSSEYKKFSELTKLPEMELTCEYTNMAILLGLLFKKDVRSKIHVISRMDGTFFANMKSLIENVFGSKEDRQNVLDSLEFFRSSLFVEYDSDYDSPEESDNDNEESDSDDNEDENSQENDEKSEENEEDE